MKFTYYGKYRNLFYLCLINILNINSSQNVLEEKRDDNELYV